MTWKDFFDLDGFQDGTDVHALDVAARDALVEVMNSRILPADQRAVRCDLPYYEGNPLLVMIAKSADGRFPATEMLEAAVGDTDDPVVIWEFVDQWSLNITFADEPDVEYRMAMNWAVDEAYRLAMERTGLADRGRMMTLSEEGEWKEV